MSRPASFVPGSVDYDGEMGQHYDRGRSLSPETIATWGQLVFKYLGLRSIRRILDLGSGSGRFSGLLATWLECEVFAVEPSQTMRGRAARQAASGVRWIAGTAEAIPLADGSLDAAWLSQVIHHVRNKERCAAELSRTLLPGGHLILRGEFGDRLDGITLWRFFPEARKVAEGFPRLGEIQQIFGAMGLELSALERVRQQTCASLKEGAALTRHRADTTLRLISDEAFYRGQARIEAAAETDDSPVWDELDLAVFVRA